MTGRAGTSGHAEPPDLAARIRDRDAEAVQEVVRVYLPQILRAARGAGLDAERAEEVTQSTFGTFIAAAPRFEGRSKVRTWLFGILYKKIAAARRKLRRDADVDDLDRATEGSFDSAASWTRRPRSVDRALNLSEVRREIERCLDALPTNQRMAFVLREVEELSTEEISRIMEVTRTNLGVLLHRARTRLRECLMRKGIEG